MRSFWKKTIAVFACAALFITAVPAAVAAGPDILEQRIASAADCLKNYAKEGNTDLLSAQDLLPAGSSLSDWTAITLALAGAEADYEGYRSALEAYVGECYERNGCLDRTKATEYHRVILTALAIGADPTAFGADSGGKPFNLVADGTYDYIGDSLGRQGLNGWIFALISLDANDYTVPERARYSRETIIGELLTAQEENGGFGLSSGSSDVDITAMTVQALSPYCTERDDVQACVERAVGWLSTQMNEDCTYSYSGSSSSESSSQVIIALCSLGIDPESDSRFAKGDDNILEALEQFRREDGGYAHTMDQTSSDFMATQQAMLALISARHLKTGQPRIYDFGENGAPDSDGTADTSGNESDNPGKALYIIVPAAVAAGAVVMMIVMRGRKKHAGTDRQDTK